MMATAYETFGGYTFSNSDSSTNSTCSAFDDYWPVYKYSWSSADASTTCTMPYYDSTQTIKVNWTVSGFGRLKQKCHVWYEYNAPVVKPQDRLREIIQSRHAPLIVASRKPLATPGDIREVRARETLCRLLGEDKFQRFIKDGFVSVRAKSGLIYQIFPGHGITNVYQNGDHIERLCVVLKGDFPPTDSLIMRYLIILNDENRFRGYAIKHQVIQKRSQAIVDDTRSLNEIFKELKEKRKKVA